MNTSKVLAQEDFEIFSALTHEEKVKNSLNWSKMQWEQDSNNEPSWKRHIGFVKYWHTRLKEAYEDTNVLLTLYSQEGNAQIDLEQIVDELQSIISLDNLTGYFKVRNPKIIGLEFINKEIRDEVMKKFKNVSTNNVTFLNWASNDGVVEITSHWISTVKNKDKIIKILEDYVTINSVEFEATNLKNKKKLRSAKMFIKGRLHKDIQAEDIPHIYYIGHLQGLFTVKGRAPLCLGCEEVGHMVAECSFAYCGRCRSKMLKKHTCNVNKSKQNSYAIVVKGYQKKEEEYEDVFDYVTIEEKERSMELKNYIYNSKLQNMEEKIMLNKDSTIIPLNLSKKQDKISTIQSNGNDSNNEQEDIYVSYTTATVTDILEQQYNSTIRHQYSRWSEEINENEEDNDEYDNKEEAKNADQIKYVKNNMEIKENTESNESKNNIENKKINEEDAKKN